MWMTVRPFLVSLVHGICLIVQLAHGRCRRRCITPGTVRELSHRKLYAKASNLNRPGPRDARVRVYFACTLLAVPSEHRDRDRGRYCRRWSHRTTLSNHRPTRVCAPVEDRRLLTATPFPLTIFATARNVA